MGHEKKEREREGGEPKISDSEKQKRMWNSFFHSVKERRGR